MRLCSFPKACNRCFFIFLVTLILCLLLLSETATASVELNLFKDGRDWNERLGTHGSVENQSNGNVKISKDSVRYRWDITEYYPFVGAFYYWVKVVDTDDAGCSKDGSDWTQFFVLTNDDISNPSWRSIGLLDTTGWIKSNDSDKDWIRHDGDKYYIDMMVKAPYCAGATADADIEIERVKIQLYVNYNKNTLRIDNPKVDLGDQVNLGRNLTFFSARIKNIGDGSKTFNWSTEDSTWPVAERWIKSKSGSLAPGASDTLEIGTNFRKIGPDNIDEIDGKLIPIFRAGLDPKSSGLKGDFYHVPGSTLSGLDDALSHSDRKLAYSNIFPTIEFHDSGGAKSALSADKPFKSGSVTTTLRKNFTAVFTGFIKVNNSGSHRFIVTTNNGFRLKIDDNMVIERTGQGTSASEYDGSIDLDEGYHPIELSFFQGSYRSKSLTLEWETPVSGSRAVVPQSVLSNGLNILVCGKPKKPTVAFTTSEAFNGKVNVRSGNSVKFNVTASRGSTGIDVEKYRWKKEEAGGSSGFSSGITASEKNYMFSDIGYYTVSCKSVDSKGVESDAEQIQVLAWNPPAVNDAPPQAQIDAGNVSWYNSKYVGIKNDQVKLMAEGTDSGTSVNESVDESIMKYLWSFDQDWNTIELEQPVGKKIVGEFYNFPSSVSPDLDTIRNYIRANDVLPYLVKGLDKIEFPSSNSDFQNQGGYNTGLQNRFFARFTGFIDVQAGDYQFHVTATDGFRLKVDGRKLAEYTGTRGSKETSASYTFPNAGFYPIELIFFEETGYAGLTLEWTPPGGSRALVRSWSKIAAHTWNAPSSDVSIYCKAVTNYGVQSDAATFKLKVYDTLTVNILGGPYTGKPEQDIELRGSINETMYAGYQGLQYQWRVEKVADRGNYMDLVTDGDGKAKHKWSPTSNDSDTYNAILDAALMTEEGLVLTGSANTYITIEAQKPTAMPGGPYRGGIYGGSFSPVQFEGNHPDYVEAPDIGHIQDWVWEFGGTGTADKALKFNGVTDFVVTQYNGVTGTSPRTVAAWIKTSTPGNYPIVSWGPNSTGAKWVFRVQTTNGTAGAIRVEVSGGYNVGTTVVADGQWHHVAVVLPQIANPNVLDTRLYVDGELEESSASDPQGISTGDGEPVTIGKDISNRFFSGMIDEVAIWDRALTGAEIESLVSFGPLTIASGLVGYWPFNEGKGATVKDLSGYQNDGELIPPPTSLPGISWSGLGTPQTITVGPAWVEGRSVRKPNVVTGIWNPTQAFNKAGTYNVALTVKSEYGKWSYPRTAEVQIIDGKIEGYVRAADLRTPVRGARLTLTSSHVYTDVLQSIANADNAAIFSLDPAYQTDLDNLYLSDDLRDAFADNGISLSQSAAVEKEGNKWIITDKQTYTVKIAGNELQVYNDKLYSTIEGQVWTETDRNGHYVFEHIPLGSYLVSVSKVDGDTIHEFETNPKATELILDAPDQLAIDFVDLSVFPVGGQITYQVNGYQVKDVVVKAQAIGGNANTIESLPSTKTSDNVNNYGFPLFSGQYLFIADLPGHAIQIKEDTPDYDSATGLVTINRARTDIDFVDLTTRELTVFVQDAGGHMIPGKTVSIGGDNGQAEGESDETDGKFVATLPPGVYTVTVLEADPPTKEVDITAGDSAVTMTIPVKIELTVSGRPKLFDVEAEFLEQFGLTQDQNPEGYMYYYPPEPRVYTYEIVAMANGHVVPDFRLFVTDEVSMVNAEPPEESEFQIQGEEGTYTVTAGLPKMDRSVEPPVAAPKRITFKAEKEGYLDSELYEDLVTVLGDVSFGSAQRIVSVPVVNYTVLHDPPGDGSYSYLDDSLTLKGIVSGMTLTIDNEDIPVYPSPWRDERKLKGFSFEKDPNSDTASADLEDKGLMDSDRTITPPAAAFTIAALAEAATGVANWLVGPFAFIIQAAKIPILGVALESGTAIPGVTGIVQYEISPSRHIETASGDELPDILGPGKGDIYLGEGWTLGLQQKYRLGIRLDNGVWKLETDEIMTYDILERTNQYVYSIRDIENLVEDLGAAIEETTDDAEKEKLSNAKSAWEDLLGKNLAYVFEKDYISQGLTYEDFVADYPVDEEISGKPENLIFSAGPVFEYSRTISEGMATTVSVKIAVESSAELCHEMEISSGFELYGSGVTFDLKTGGGGAINSGTEYGSEWEGGKSAEQTVGFVLNDDDVGDNISTRVYADPVWGTPIFFQDAGSITSDPWEPGTNKGIDVSLSLIEEPDSGVPFDYNDGAYYKVKVDYTGMRDLDTFKFDFEIFAPSTENVNNAYVEFNEYWGPYSIGLEQENPSAIISVYISPSKEDLESNDDKQYSLGITVLATDDGQIGQSLTLKPKFADLRAPRATIIAPYAGQRVSPVLFPSEDPFDIRVVSNDTDLASVQVQIRSKQPDSAWEPYNGVWGPWRNLSGMVWEDGVENSSVKVLEQLDRDPPRSEFTFRWVEDEIASLGVGEYAIRAVATDKATRPNVDADPPEVVFLVDNSKPMVLTSIPDYQARESERMYRGELSAIFTDDMRPDDFSDRTFVVTDLLKGGEKVAGFVSYSPALRKGIFVPVVPFQPNGFYRAEIRTDEEQPDGTLDKGLHDLAGNPLDSAFMWTFRTTDTPFEPIWSITLSATDGTDTDANNIAGVEYGALDGEDEKDARAVPSLTSRMRLSFLDRDKEEFDRDIRPADGRLSHHWFFVIDNAANGSEVTIRYRPSIKLTRTARQYQDIWLVEFDEDGNVTQRIKLDPTQAPTDPNTGEIGEVELYTYTNAGETSRYFRLDVQKASLVAAELRAGSSGWKFLSVPIIPQRPDPFVNLGDDIDPFQLYKYDTESSGYIIYPLDIGQVSIQPGHGYFTRLSDDVEVDVGGIWNNEDSALSLGVAGWHSIGNPFILPVDVADLRINDISFDSAVADGLVEATLYRWKIDADPGKNPDAYEAITSGQQLEPWEGFWIKTIQADTTLTIPAPNGLANAEVELPESFNPPMAPSAPGSFRPPEVQFDLRLELISGFSSDVTTTLGARKNAQMDWDTFDQSEPPTLSKTVSAYFDHSDWSDLSGLYNKDYQPALEPGEQRIWNFTVYADRPDAEMTLSWGNAVSQVPGDIMLYFRRADGQDEWQDMREIRSVDLVSSSRITEIPFEVRAQRFEMSPPSDVQAIAGEKQVILRWKSDDTGFIDSYMISRQEGSEESWREGQGTLCNIQQDLHSPLSEFVDNDVFEEVMYTYQISVRFRSGAELRSELLPVRTLPVIKMTALLQSYPNPFNPEVWIPYELAEQTTVSIQVYNASGKLVRTLDLGVQPRGRYTSMEKAAYWDGRNQAGESSASGIYFYALKAGEFAATRKMVILK